MSPDKEIKIDVSDKVSLYKNRIENIVGSLEDIILDSDIAPNIAWELFQIVDSKMDHIRNMVRVKTMKNLNTKGLKKIDENSIEQLFKELNIKLKFYGRVAILLNQNDINQALNLFSEDELKRLGLKRI